MDGRTLKDGPSKADPLLVRPTWIGRPGLLAKIGMVTLVPVLVMAFLLVRSLDGSARSGALERAQHEGIVTARLLGVENLRAGLTGTMSASQRGELARGFRLVGSRPRSPLLAAALEGKSGVGELGDAVDVYSAVVAPGGEPLGALRVRMPAGAILSLIHISEPTRRTPISYAVF